MSESHRKALEHYWNSLKGKPLSLKTYSKKAIKKRVKTRKEKDNYKQSIKAKKKISKSLEGNTNKKGYKCTLKQIKNLKKSHLGNKSALGHKCNKQQRKNISEGRKGIEPWNKDLNGKKYKKHYKNGFGGTFPEGKIYTNKERKTLRISAIKRIKRQLKDNQIINPCIGKDEKEILDQLEYEYSLKIERQYEVEGYFLDGYIPKLNLAIEIDEKYHNDNIKRDKIRQREIENFLDCEFIRVKI